MKWSATAHAANIGLKRTRWVDQPLSHGGRLLAVLEGHGEICRGLENSVELLEHHAYAVHQGRTRLHMYDEMHMYDLFSQLATETRNCADGIRLAVASIFPDGHVVLGTIGDSNTVLARRSNDCGAFECTFGQTHVLLHNPQERERLAGMGVQCSSLYVTTGALEMTTLTGFLGDVRMAEIATRIPSVTVFENVEPGDVLVLATSGLYDLAHHVELRQWHRFFARVHSAERMLTMLRYLLAKSSEDVSVALAYALPD